MDLDTAMHIVRRTANASYEALHSRGALSYMVTLSYHKDHMVPPVFYRHQKHELYISIPRICRMELENIRDDVLDAMATAADFDRYHAEMEVHKNHRAHSMPPKYPRYREGHWKTYRAMLNDVD